MELGSSFYSPLNWKKARNYLAVNAKQLSEQINELDAELRALKLFSVMERESHVLNLEEKASLIPEELSIWSDVLEGEYSTGLGASFSTSRTISVVRGDEGELQEGSLTISFKKCTSPGIVVASSACGSDPAELLLDDTTLRMFSDVELEDGQNLVETNEPLADKQRKVEWAGRAQRRGEASRPRGGAPRIINLNTYTNMDMDKDKETNVQPQRSRSLSGRRASPTVPGAGMSLSSAGPASPLPTGGEFEMATVVEAVMEKDPLALPHVEESSDMDLEFEEEASEEETSIASRVKRKARASPGDFSPSEEEMQKDIYGK